MISTVRGLNTLGNTLVISRNRIDMNEITSRNKGKEILLIFVGILLLGVCFIYHHDLDNCGI